MNLDGHISKDEFDHYFQSLNINDKAMSEEVFTGIDENKDGFLSTSGKNKIIIPKIFYEKI
jgi:hypothetical protein